MPLHRIYHQPSAFSSTDKQTLSERITKLYTDVGLPAFYVVVLFIPVEQESFFVGGKPTDNFVRVVIQHLARQIPDEERKRKFSENYENVLAPFIKDKGYDWEVNIQFFFFLLIIIILSFHRCILKKYHQICGEKMDLFHRSNFLRLKKNGHDLTNQYHTESQFCSSYHHL